MSLSEHISEQARRVDRFPSDPQKHAGNYQKGHVKIHGLDISIENPRGSFREGRDADGHHWRARLPAHYGDIKRTEGADGDPVDVFVGPHPKSPLVYIVDQLDRRTGKFDEHKTFIGFSSPKQVRNTYFAAFSDGKGKQRLGHLEEMTVTQFKHWLKKGNTKHPVRQRADGGRIGMADGGIPNPFDQFDGASSSGASAAPAANPFDQFDQASTESAEPADHGLSEREALSPVGKALSPITGYWPTYQRMNQEARNQVARGYNELGDGTWNTIKGAANIGAGALGYVGSPISAAYRSIVGQPIEDVTGIPREYTEFAAELATPGIGLTHLPAEPGAVAEAAPAVMPRSAEATRAQELGNEFGINYSRGQADQNLDRIRYEDMAARGAYGPEAQRRAASFFDEQFQAVQQAARNVGQRVGAGEQPLNSPADAGASLNAEIADRAEQARNLRDTLTTRAEQEAAAQRQMVTDRQRAIDEAIAGGNPAIGGARDAGEAVNAAVRDRAAANRAEFQGLYREFGQLPGEFRADAVRGLGTRIRNDLSFRDEPVVVDDQLTPSASRAIQALDEMSRPNIQNRASAFGQPNPDEIAGVNLRGIDQMRKKLVAYYQSARNNPTDARAMRAIMDSYDGQIERAISEGLFSGDPRALQALQDARASYARYRQTFGPQRAGDDVGTAMRRIVDRNATPEETANMIIGSGKIGQAGLPVRIADRLERVLGTDSPEWNSIRQAMWQKASQVRNAAGEVDPERSAANISDFTNSTLARRMFSPQELGAMRAHAQGIRDLDRTIESLPATQQAQHAQSIYQQAFGGENLSGSQRAVFRRMVEGTATPEETAQVMFSTIAGGNPGNAVRALRAVRNIVGNDSPVMGAVRQGVWQKLTQNPFGKDQMGQQKMVQAINEFLNGKGRDVARQLYSPEERALMSRYAEAVRRTIIPKYARTNSDTAPALLHAVRKYASAITSALGVGMHGGITGGLEGYGVGKLVDNVAEKIGAARENRKLSASLDNLMPEDRSRRASDSASSMGSKALRSIPYTSKSAPPINIGAALSQLQGTVPSRANQKQPQPHGVGH